ncbi:MAG: MFS transporter [Cyanobacteria bacterium P01_G01_bin.39]
MKPKTSWLMAIICALAVANLYYNQPILAQIAQNFNASAADVGWIPTLTQIGYASGLLLFVPLGDCEASRRHRLERCKLVITMLILTAIALFLAALSPNLLWLILASFLIGAATIMAQILLPFATDLVSEKIQGKIIGNLMSALFVGTLFARPLGGWLGEQFGWRGIYWLAGFMMLLLAAVSTKLLPRSQPKSKLSYGQLMRSLLDAVALTKAHSSPHVGNLQDRATSLLTLIKTYPALRSASFNQAMLFGGFSLFWSTLAFLLSRPPYNYGSNAIGLFGLVGIAGIIAAPILGKLADKGNAKTLRSMVTIATTLTIASYLIFWQFGTQLWGLIIGSLLLNLGSQGGLIANQVKIYRLDKNARSRLNTVFMVATFTGASLGSILGAYGWSIDHWKGVCIAGLLLGGIAAIQLWFPHKT